MSLLISDDLEEWKITSKTGPFFCKAPVQALHVNARGEVSPDSQYRGVFGNLREQTLEEILDSAARISLSNKISRKGELPEECANCRKKEESIGHSRRIFFQDKLGDSQNHEHLLYLDLNLSNKCNFKCRMCNSESSSSWALEEKKLASSAIGIRDLPLRSLECLDEECLERLLARPEPFRHLKYLALRGGEPLMEKANLQVLEKFVEWGLSGQIIVDLSVNGSISNSEIMELLSQFKRVDLYLSVDGIGDHFDYIRSDGKLSFADFERNKEDFRKIKNAHIMYAVSISIYNLFLLPELWEWYQGSRKDGEDILLTNIVVRPSYLNFQLLPLFLKTEFQKKLENSDWFLGSHKNGAPFLATQGRNLLLGSLHREVFHEEEKIRLLQQFFAFNFLLDQQRETSLKNLPPFGEFSPQDLVSLIQGEVESAPFQQSH